MRYIIFFILVILTLACVRLETPSDNPHPKTNPPQDTDYGDYKRVDCPDGRIVLVLKDLKKAYPELVGEEKETRVKATLSIINSLANGTVEITKKDSLVKLSQDLDQSNIALTKNLEQAFLGYQNAPCDTVSSNKFWRSLKETQNYHLTLTTIAKMNNPSAEDIINIIKILNQK